MLDLSIETKLSGQTPPVNHCVAAFGAALF